MAETNLNAQDSAPDLSGIESVTESEMSAFRLKFAAHTREFKGVFDAVAQA